MGTTKLVKKKVKTTKTVPVVFTEDFIIESVIIGRISIRSL